MKKISFWAKGHVLQSRILIIFFWITLNIIGVFLGKLFKELNITIPEYSFNICLCFLLILWIKYPQNRNKATYRRHIFYFHKKLFDLFFAVLTFIVIVYTGNHWKNLSVNTQKAAASTILNLPKDSSVYKNLIIKNFIFIIKSQDKSRVSSHDKRKLIKKQIRTINKTKDLSKTEKTILIILSILIASTLLMGVAVLSCSLSCSGMEGLAALVGIGGITLIIILLLQVLKRINRKKEDTKKLNVTPK